MQVKPAALSKHLSAGIKSIYLISGDETLLVEEACDAVNAAARSAGFTERSVQYVDGGFKWHDLTQAAASLSLFAEKRIIDVRVPTAKFDREASEVLRGYAASPAPDTLLLLRAPRLDPRQRSSAWFKALDKAGVVVLVWPVNAGELPRWLEGRLQSANLQFSPDALTYFAQRVEGNLLAAVQEIGKLQLLGLEQPIGTDALMAVTGDAAHYDTFELLDAMFGGDAARVARMLRGLAAEGVAPFAILGALTAQLRRLDRGDRFPPQRQRLLDRFVRRLGSRAVIDRVLAECALVDQQGKGQLLGDAWASLENVLLRLAGARLVSLESQLPHLLRP